MTRLTMFKRLQNAIIVSDKEFDGIYTDDVQKMAECYFTPVDVAIQASHFLAQNPNANILDIGSGAGKFCLIGAAVSGGYYTGVERDPALHTIASEQALKFEFSNVSFIHDDIISINFKDYNAFYLFNPFIDLLNQSAASEIKRDENKAAFGRYTHYVFEQLQDMPEGTLLVTYFAYPGAVPPYYDLHSTAFEGKLKCWIHGGAKRIEKGFKD